MVESLRQDLEPPAVLPQRAAAPPSWADFRRLEGKVPAAAAGGGGGKIIGYAWTYIYAAARASAYTTHLHANAICNIHATTKSNAYVINSYSPFFVEASRLSRSEHDSTNSAGAFTRRLARHSPCFISAWT